MPRWYHLGVPRSTISPGDGDPRHGTPNGYLNLSCKCADCKRAHSIYHRALMHADPERLRKHADRERQRRALNRQ